jgi:hypothetical protein
MRIPDEDPEDQNHADPQHWKNTSSLFMKITSKHQGEKHISYVYIITAFYLLVEKELNLDPDPKLKLISDLDTNL